jgi:hypothetical protein
MSAKFVQIKALGSKLAQPQGVIDFHYMYKEKNKKTSSFKKPKELDVRCLALNIFLCVSSKFVQIKALGSKLALPLVSFLFL